MYNLLIVDDELSVRYSFKKLLNSSKYNITEAANATEALNQFLLIKPHLVILDIEMPGKDGIEVLQELKKISPNTPVIIITAYGSGDRVIKAMKYGAFEYIEKPFDIPRLISTVEEALSTSIKIKDNTLEGLDRQKAKRQINTADENAIIGESAAIKEVFKLIGRVAASDASILIVGESGTGKELVAKAIHRYSDRFNRPFIAINCAAIPETLLESELFGHEKGAFTGADRLKTGKFEEAHTGTLFLDEIGDMSLPLQAKLLRVLQEGTLERVGSSKSIKVDARIVAATNRNLENDIIGKSFREDLYYRLKVVTISLPPLRMRTEDIPLLSSYFLKRYSSGKGERESELSKESLERLINYSWPGNIRELENVIKRAILLSKGNIITPELLFEGVEKPVQPKNINSRLANYLDNKIESQEGSIYQLVIDQMEQDLLQWALQRTGGNRAQAAKILGISRVMIHERIEKFKL